MEAGELVARRCATLPQVLTGDGFQQLSDAKVYVENGLTNIEGPHTELINMLTYYRHQCLGQITISGRRCNNQGLNSKESNASLPWRTPWLPPKAAAALLSTKPVCWRKLSRGDVNRRTDKDHLMF
jgi:hypothetical protein